MRGPAMALLVVLCGLLAAAPPAAADERVYPLPGNAGALALPVPEGWADEIVQPDAGMPPTIRLTVPGRERDFLGVITPLWPEFGAAPDFGTAAGVRRVVEASAARIGPDAVERRIEIVPIGGGRTGFHFSATDGSLVGRTPAPGEYRYLTQGAVMVGRLLCAFTLLSNDEASAETARALDMLRGAAHRLGT